MSNKIIIEKKESKDYSLGYFTVLIMWIIIIPALSIFSFWAWNHTLPYYNTSERYRYPVLIMEILFKLSPWMIYFLVILNIFFFLLFFRRKKAWSFIAASIIFAFLFIYLGVQLYVAHIPFYKFLYFPRHGGWIDPRIIGTDNTPIADKNIVLLKQGNAYGALIFNNQAGYNPVNGENFDCTFYYRDDGQGTFNNKDINVHCKEFHFSKDHKYDTLTFGPFNVRYYTHFCGIGVIIYEYGSRVPISEIKPDALRICITDERDISKIDATDTKWIYKASPVDWEGVRAK